MKQSTPSTRDAGGPFEGADPFEAMTFGPATFPGATALLATCLQGWR